MNFICFGVGKQKRFLVKNKIVSGSTKRGFYSSNIYILRKSQEVLHLNVIRISLYITYI